ncbi:hypothetical protein [Microcoleus sp. EPA2]|uniref:hypothetical protein n=1 Tax=Microcoleus sp. EPA2 TaxID=2841654 RepID=UPI00312B33F3
MNEKMLLSKDQLIIASIGIISLIFFSFIIGDMLGIVCLFSNHTLAKTLFGIFLFFPATFIFFVGLLLMSYGVFHYLCDGRDTAPEKGSKMILNSVVSIFFPGIFILVTDVIFLKVPFGIHLLFSYCFLLLLLFATQVYREWSAIPEQDAKARFIVFLENIVPIQFQEEWLGDLQEHYHELIKDSTPLWKVYLIILFTGLGLIRSYLWLKVYKLVSRWMIRAK